MARKQLGPDCDFDTNFVPRYEPWNQRLCLVPNADFFRSVRKGQSSVVTGSIETFAENGVRLQDGTDIEARAHMMSAAAMNVVIGYTGRKKPRQTKRKH